MKNYCHLCGAKYVEGKTQPWECSGCGNLSYTSSKPAACLILFDETGRVLITERAREPNKGKYDMAGGFIDLHESVEDALTREVEEELSLKTSQYIEPKFVKSHIEPYFYSKEDLSVLVMFFVSVLKPGEEVFSNDDVASAKFVELKDLEGVDFSIDSYPDLIRKAHALIFN